uniref:Saccharopine dehydrogenase-like oxidoreductase n=1 Tax=Esox lucius TaxID=8010 RepID=A0A3P8Y2I9_ESOLU
MATVISNRPYHIIVFGASGFTGQFVVEEVARNAKEGPSGSMKWALAGRSRHRLEGVLEQAADSLNKPELRIEVDIIVADVSDADSLAIMCQQGLVVLNCVGPYRFYGEPVVKACIENGAHCIDICGEPQFLEGMQLEYHSKAMVSGVYVIGSCGFDSIPADMGILYTKDHFKGTLTAVESFLTIHTGPEGGCAHDSTWQSAIYGFADSGSLRKLRKKFGHQPLPVVGAPFKKRYGQMSNVNAVLKDNRSIKELSCLSVSRPPQVQYTAYVGVGGVWSLIKLFCGGLIFWFLGKFRLGRKLLITFPEIFSFGMFTKSGPSRKQMEGTSFRLTFFGEGYAEGTEPSQGRPNARICTQIHGAEPGYVATSVTMVQAAITVLNEPQFLPVKGGVYSPGAVFAKTTLIHRLNKHGLVFTLPYIKSSEGP